MAKKKKQASPSTSSDNMPSSCGAKLTNSGSVSGSVCTAKSRFCKTFLEILPSKPAVCAEETAANASLEVLSPNGKKTVNSRLYKRSSIKRLGVVSPSSRWQSESDSYEGGVAEDHNEKVR